MEKKLTRDQLQRRIDRAVLHIDRTKETQDIYFTDKGLRIVATEDRVVIETGYHQHVFMNFAQSGMSRPYIYTKTFLDIALKYKDDILADGGYVYKRLFDVLKDKKDKTEYNIAWYYDLWLYNIFQPLYSIGETKVESFLVYESYLHNIARNAVILSEKDNEVTNRGFVEKVCENELEYVKDMDEIVIFDKKTDEEVMRENIDAIDAVDNEKFMEESMK